MTSHTSYVCMIKHELLLFSIDMQQHRQSTEVPQIKKSISRVVFFRRVVAVRLRIDDGKTMQTEAHVHNSE